MNILDFVQCYRCDRGNYLIMFGTNPIKKYSTGNFFIEFLGKALKFMTMKNPFVVTTLSREQLNKLSWNFALLFVVGNPTTKKNFTWNNCFLGFLEISLGECKMSILAIFVVLYLMTSTWWNFEIFFIEKLQLLRVKRSFLVISSTSNSCKISDFRPWWSRRILDD